MTLRAEIRALLHLAAPLVVARVGHNLMGVVDTVVAGQILGEQGVAVVGMSATLYFFSMIFAWGLLYGLDPVVSHAVGAGDAPRARAAFATGRVLAMAMALPVMVFAWFAADAVGALGHDAALIAECRAYLRTAVLGLPAALLFQCYTVYLTANGHTRVFFVITLVANVVNLAADLWFVHGGLGVPALGVSGIGLATALGAWVQLGCVVFVMRRGGRLAELRAPLLSVSRALLRRTLSLGVPVGLQYTLEMGSFALTTVLMGLFGQTLLAGHNIALNVAALTFVVALGVSSAASVRVGHAYGRRDVAGVAVAGRAAFVVGLAWATLGSATMVLFRGPITALYTDEPATAAAASGLLVIAALFQFADASQAIGFGVLRGTGDTRVPAAFNIAGYWLLGIPVGIAFAFGGWPVAMEGGRPEWLWWGLTLALVVIALALAFRFGHRVRRLRETGEFG